MAQIGLTTLPNGIRVVSERFLDVSIALSVRIRVGARDDPPGQEGISHLLEHMLLRGSEGYSPEERAAISDRLGDQLRLSVSHEDTVLEWSLLPTQLEAGLALVADLVLNPTFADLEVEREVVLTEMEDEDADHSILSDALSSQAVFGHHPLSRRVIGTKRAVQSISEADLRAHHARHYSGSGIVISAAGDIRHQELVKLVRRLFAAAPRRALPRRRRPTLAAVPYSYRRKTASERYSLAFAAPGVAMASPLLAPCELVMDALTNLESSLLWKELRLERGLVYSVNGWVSTFSDAGQIGLRLTTAPETARQARRVVFEGLARVQDEGLGERLELARASRLTAISLSGSDERADLLGEQVMNGLLPCSLAEARRRLAAVDHRQLKRALKLFAPDRFSVIGVTPGK